MLSSEDKVMVRLAIETDPLIFHMVSRGALEYRDTVKAHAAKAYIREHRADAARSAWVAAATMATVKAVHGQWTLAIHQADSHEIWHIVDQAVTALGRKWIEEDTRQPVVTV